MESSKAINAIGSAFSGVFNFLKAPVKGGMEYLEKTGKEGSERTFKGFAKATVGGDENGRGFLDFGIKDKEGHTDYYSGAKIAGGLAGIGLGYRFLSGGGVYRDKNGNTDIAGLPFV